MKFRFCFLRSPTLVCKNRINASYTFLKCSHKNVAVDRKRIKRKLITQILLVIPCGEVSVVVIFSVGKESNKNCSREEKLLLRKRQEVCLKSSQAFLLRQRTDPMETSRPVAQNTQATTGFGECGVCKLERFKQTIGKGNTNVTKSPVKKWEASEHLRRFIYCQLNLQEWHSATY
ncbi:hypothetical protein OUZ56_028496 [Daphnia magna]|uniref:Uncharacterized protein n=1 Tax=Daphnia magna TaxID=35525 RepID=A0ABR0B409_9CRUS|nr:hypothetical protein OUZ56_028496 [Daphnia magna]